jgi:hypothetical protein
MPPRRGQVFPRRYRPSLRDRHVAEMFIDGILREPLHPAPSVEVFRWVWEHERGRLLAQCDDDDEREEITARAELLAEL